MDRYLFNMAIASWYIWILTRRPWWRSGWWVTVTTRSPSLSSLSVTFRCPSGGIVSLSLPRETSANTWVTTRPGPRGTSLGYVTRHYWYDDHCSPCRGYDDRAPRAVASTTICYYYYYYTTTRPWYGAPMYLDGAVGYCTGQWLCRCLSQPPALPTRATTIPIGQP